MEALQLHPRAISDYPIAMVEENVYSTVHQHKPETFSKVLDKTSSTISNEANPNYTSHKLGLIDSILIQNQVKDYRILQAYASALGYAVIPIAQFEGVSDTELLDAYANWHKEIGDVAKTVSQALQDRKIQRHEYLAIRKEGLEQIEAFHEFLARLEAVIDDRE